MIENHMLLPYADPEEGEPRYCHSHQMAFTDYCQACDEERMQQLHDEHAREITDETLQELREIGQL